MNDILDPIGSGKRKLVSKEQKTDNCNIQKERDNEKGNRAARPCFKIFYSLIHCESITSFFTLPCKLVPGFGARFNGGKASRDGLPTGK